jgi:putative zinc finger/helix-turn-helix YgiT family protein
MNHDDRHWQAVELDIDPFDDNEDSVAPASWGDASPCPSCGSADIETLPSIESFEYGDSDPSVVLQAYIPARKCRACGFEYADHQADVARHEAVCHHLHVLTPVEIKAIRLAHKLKRKEFAALTGFGDATLARWESGALIQNLANDRFLRALRHSKVYEVVCAEAGSQDFSPQPKKTFGFRCVRDVERLRGQAQGFLISASKRRSLR